MRNYIVELTTGTPEEAVASIENVLTHNVLLSLATVGGPDTESQAWANTVYFAWTADPLQIYFLSEPTSQHSLNLTNDTSAAAVVFDSAQTGDGGKLGLQVFGNCERAVEEDLARGLRAYQQRFAGFDATITEPADFERGIIDSRLYSFHIASIKIFDEARFGEEVWVTATFKKSIGIALGG